MRDTAVIIRIDAEIFKIQASLRDHDDAALKELLAQLIEKRAEKLADMEREARERIK